MRVSAMALVAGLLQVAGAWAAHGQTGGPSAFYAGKTISVVVGSGPVGAYADYAQLLVAHLKEHLPGKPNLIFQTMPGAGGMIATNHAFNIAPKDGTYILLVAQNFVIDQVLKMPAVRFDARQFGMIGRFNSNTPLSVGWTAAGVTSIEVARAKEVITGGAGPSSPTDILPQVLNAVAGTKFKLISGYKGVDEMMLAMQRGETHAMVASLTSFQSVFETYVRESKVSYLAQFALKRHRDIPDIPTTGELAVGAQGRAVADLLASGSDIGRMVLAPPGVPPDRLDALRKAVAAMVRDAEFLREAQKRKLQIDYADASEIEGIVARAMAAPEAAVVQARSILGIK